MKRDVIYEPRALWSVGRIDNSAGSGGAVPSRLLLPLGDFLNGESWNVTLSHVLVDAVGYAFDIYSDAGTLTSANFRNNRAAVLEFARVKVGVRRRHYWNRRHYEATLLGDVPSATGPARVEQGAVFTGPDVHNAFLWDFSREKWAMKIPRSASMFYQLSGYRLPNIGGVTLPTAPRGRIAIYEGPHEGRGGGARYHGNVRYADVPIQATANPVLGTDGFGAPALSDTVATFPPVSRFNARAFSQQEVGGYGPSSLVTGMGISIDQADYDAALQQATTAGAQGIIASLGSQIGTEARMSLSQGGSGALFWEPGAPLSLVSPTKTTARVYRLLEPVVLAPGDGLEVEIEVPDQVEVALEPRPTIYQLGVSLTGYAEVTG